MNMHFENAAARAPRAGAASPNESWMTDGDILVRLDHAGFVVHASQNADVLGIDLSSLLLMPHIADFADPAFHDAIVDYVAGVLADEPVADAMEFPVLRRALNQGELSARDTGEGAELARHWYALSLLPVEPDDGNALQGAMGTLRSVQGKYQGHEESESAAALDPHTGLATRAAFCGHLTRAIAAGQQASLALFAIDNMRAIFMQYGQTTADEIRWGFARFLETMTDASQVLAQVDDERFGVILPGMSISTARAWAQTTLTTFAGLAMGGASRTSELTASAGLATLDVSADWTLRQGELGLVMARAGGGMQVAKSQLRPGFANGAFVEREMEAAVQRAIQRYS
ncbi:GGDEF domain-containing protein [Erythrobacter sp.]|jgi:GGDEF domain-containing protein|uniref:GGDEF domain-containing protein n=1 Tax=Erythrobacter sp. TaxID=1042 RepID=UPI002EA9866A|nr:diguanylate cyclase [Erythrobacter sp.]